MKHIISKMVFAGVLIATAACSSPPYVHNAGEYNRAAENFGRPVTDISDVTVCYSSSSATPRQVTRLAVAECARFNKTAMFFEQSYSICPMTAPIAAIYNCEGGDDYGLSGDRQGIPKGTLMNYDGIPFRY